MNIRTFFIVLISIQAFIFTSCKDETKYSSTIHSETPDTGMSIDVVDTETNNDTTEILEPPICNENTFRYVLITGEPSNVNEEGASIKGIYITKNNSTSSPETFWVSRAISPSNENFQTKIDKKPDLNMMCDENFDKTIQNTRPGNDFVYYSFGDPNNPIAIEQGDRVGVIIINNSECSEFEDKTYSLMMTTCPGNTGIELIRYEVTDQEIEVIF